MADVAAISKAVKDVRSGATKEVTIKPYNASTSTSKHDQHQLVFFFKPEMTMPGVNLDDALKVTLDALSKAKVEITSVRVLSGDYLGEHDIMVKHYGVIANISKNGESVISASAKQALTEKFSDFPNATVLGGHQFLAKFPELNAFSLTVLNDNLGTTRLAGGTYAMKIKVFGKNFIVLNPFHAYQLVPYTSTGNSIVVFEVLSPTPWADLRTNVCGTTDPSTAVEGSVRKSFLNKKSDLGLKDVDRSANGVHMSAGPLEGMVELTRFFDVKYADTAFGAALKGAGYTEEQIKTLAENPVLDVGGKKVSAFDLTEEKDVKESLTLLKDFKVSA